MTKSTTLHSLISADIIVNILARNYAFRADKLRGGKYRYDIVHAPQIEISAGGSVAASLAGKLIVVSSQECKARDLNHVRQYAYEELQELVLDTGWGIRPPADMNVVASWGARAIYRPTSSKPIDVPWDRQAMNSRRYNDAAKCMDVARLRDWIDNVAMPHLIDLVPPAGSKEIATDIDGPFTMRVQPKGDYLYIGAWVTQAKGIKELQHRFGNRKPR